MNVAAATIATVIGGVFFAAATTFQYRPDFIKTDKMIDAIMTTNQSKARAAVTRLLIDPTSAEFDGLRTVQVDGASFVCGSVNAKDRTGHLAGYRAFVYTSAIDFARIDDDGVIAQRHDAYRACPLSVQDEKIAQQKVTISPGALQAVKAIQKAIPATSDTTALSSLSDQVSGSGAVGGGSGAMQSQLQQFGGAPASGSAGQQSDGSFKVASTDVAAAEAAWRADQPPAAWPAFPPEHPLAKPAPRRDAADALALANDVEERWMQGKVKGTKIRRPSQEDIMRAERALLAIDPKEADFHRAWASFVRLRALEREAAI